MKLPLNIMLAAVVTLRVPAQELTTSVLDAAGSMSAGGDVEIAGSLGSFAGLSSDAGTVTARAGFPGQIYDPVGVAITPSGS